MSMYFVLQTPSLQQLAGVKIVSHLWNQDDVFEDRPIEDLTDDAPEWLIIRNRVKSKVSALPIPQRCKKLLVDLIKPLETEIIHYCQYYKREHRAIQLGDILLSTPLCWTMHGTVDYGKTVQLIVKDRRVDLQRRFELACINCLQDEAREMFRKLTEERRREWVQILYYARRADLSRLIIFFTRSLNLDVRGEILLFFGIPLINKRLFEDTLRGGNRGMCEYLFQTLNPEEKDQVLGNCQRLLIRDIQSPICTLFYISLMNEEQQRHMLRECIIDLLKFLLVNWPVQSLFREAVKCGWQFLDKRFGLLVLFNITRKINDARYNDFDYCSLFWECWRLTPANYASRFFDDVTFIDGLLLTKRVEFIELIINEAPSHKLENAFNKIGRVLMDESVISEAALMEWKQTAALNSSNSPEDEQKRWRSEYVSRLIDRVMEKDISFIQEVTNGVTYHRVHCRSHIR